MDKVVIVGGGCAGLAAGYTLDKLGIDFTLLESSQRTGGRIVDVDWNDRIHFPGSALMTEPQWSTTFEFVNELGISDDLLKVEKLCFGFERKGKRYYLSMGDKLPLGEIMKFKGVPMAKVVPQGIKFLRAISPYQKQLRSKHDDFGCLSEISEMSTEEFALKHGGPELVNYVLDPFLGTMTLGKAKDISIAHPISLLTLMEGMCTFKHGLSEVTNGLYERISDHVRLRTPVEEIIIEGGKVQGVRTPQGIIECDKVICALDAHDALAVAPGMTKPMRDALSTCKYSSTWCYTFGVPKRFLPDDFLSFFIPSSDHSIITMIGDLNAGCFGHLAPDGYGLVKTFTAGAYDDALAPLSDEERNRHVIEEIRSYYPEFPEHPDFTHVLRFDRAINLESPGQFNAIEQLKSSHINDIEGLYLAGEYLFLIACSEGGFNTGKKAALQVAADLRAANRPFGAAA